MSVKKSKFVLPPPAPIFKPTLKEFEDPLGYIEKIRPIAQKFGICKILSPKQWSPPFSVDYNTFKFRPKVQMLNEVGFQSRVRNTFIRSLEAFWEYKNISLETPVICGIHLDLFKLHSKVCQYGGSHQVSKNKQWLMVCYELGMGESSKSILSQVKASYDKIVQPYLEFCDDKFREANKDLFQVDVSQAQITDKTATTLESPKMMRSKLQISKNKVFMSCQICDYASNEYKMVECVECNIKFHIDCLDPQLSDVLRAWTCSRCLQIQRARELSLLEAQVFGFSQSNCKTNLKNFAAFADNFKRTYFNNRENVSLKDVEEEYWRLVAAEDSIENVTVKYGADISSAHTSSGFPTKANRHLLSESDQKYIDNGWNLNNLSTLNKSVFRFISNDISGMTIPWCYVGMVFSCSSWHIEDHWSYSINYMHMGECKTWYGVPESEVDLFEELMGSKSDQLFKKSPDPLKHITTQINPTILTEKNIKVYRIDQGPGEFVVTFPRAYHSSFNQGFNFSEAVNFCSADWLTKGRASIENYRRLKRPSVFSHNELICKMVSNIDLLDIVLLKAVYEEIVIIQKEEKLCRTNICKLANGACRTERFQSDQILIDNNRECVYCHTTLYMSGVSCSICCKDGRMMCLDHLTKVCTCVTLDNVVLKYRFSLDEISSLLTNAKTRLDQYNLWLTQLYHLAQSDFCSRPGTAEDARIMKNVTQFIEDLGVHDSDNFSIKSIKEKPNLEELRILLQLGRKMNCPEALLEFLDSIMYTCQKAMNMTDELLRSHRGHTNAEDKENEIKNESKLRKIKEKKFSKIVSRNEDQSNKLTMPEMRMLVEKLRSLPVHVPQLKETAQILGSINAWRRKVKRVVSTNEVIEEGTLKKLIESGESNLVYLSEYQMLQRMRIYALWIVEAQNLIDGGDLSSLPTLSHLRKLRDEGVELINTVEIDRVATLIEKLDVEEEDIANRNYEEISDYRRTGWNIIISNLKSYEKQLSKEIISGESMQKEAEDILKSTPGVFALGALKTLLRNAKIKLNCVVTGIERLKEVLKEALLVNVKITEMWQKLQLCRRLVHIDDMQALIKQADSLCVSFIYLPELRSLNCIVESWRNNLHNLFIKSSYNSYLPTSSLVEVLFPRPPRMFKLMIARESVSSKLVAVCKSESTLAKEDADSGDDDRQSDEQKISRNMNGVPRKNRGNQKRLSLTSDDPQIARKDNVSAFESFLQSAASSDIESFNYPYKNMCINELEWMWNLRELNEDKARKDSNGHDFYCFCRKRGMDQKGAQVMCDLCQDWFHSACLEIQNKDMSKKKFLCPQCERSKRPAFEVILAEKRKLEHEAKMLKIPEHIALCLMSQRVISFHKHTNQLFSPQTELGAVFVEYKKLFGVQAMLPKYQQTVPMSIQHDLSPVHDAHSLDASLLHLATGKQSRKTPHGMPKPGVPSTTYPLALPPVAAPLSPVPSKDTLRSIRRLKMSLSEDARRELEEIYIELCLLEVDQPTVTWIWKLYHGLIDEDNDDEEEENESDGDKYATKQETSNIQLSDSSDNADNRQDTLESKLYSKSIKSIKRLDAPKIDKYVKQECLTSPEERKEPLQKFSFKRKLVAKNPAKSPIKIKKQSKLKPVKNVVTRKGGRRGKGSTERNEMWDGNFDMPSQYYDEEDDVILLDNVEIGKKHKTLKDRHKSKRLKTTSASDSKSLYDDTQVSLSKHSSASGRQQRRSSANFYKKQISVDRSDNSDENSPPQKPCDVKPSAPNHLKRGRKPSAVAEAARDNASLPITKRRRKGAHSRSNGGTSKRVCNDDCEADRCVQQSSEKVNWIACDLCNLWYHWLCVGIKSEMQIGDSFLCRRCKDVKTRTGVKQEIRSLCDEVVDDMETDDLNVTLDEDALDDCQPTPVDRQPHTYSRRSLSSSPPFLQPECGLQEEIVEISYVSHSDTE